MKHLILIAAALMALPASIATAQNNDATAANAADPAEVTVATNAAETNVVAPVAPADPTLPADPLAPAPTQAPAPAPEDTGGFPWGVLGLLGLAGLLGSRKGAG